MKIAIAYIPVLHKGYLNFLKEVEKEEVEKLYIIGDDILENNEDLDYIHRKDRLRALPVELIVGAVKSITNIPINVIDQKNLKSLNNKEVIIYTPREDISIFLLKTFLPEAKPKYVNIFLRWNKENIGEDKIPHAVRTVNADDFHKEVVTKILVTAEGSFDWWRQVGAALVKDDEVLFTSRNEHLPEEQLPNIIGDTRALFKKGIYVNYVTTAHAEIALIAMAARKGVITEGADLYVTDFPCPYCARAVAKAGIRTLYFLKGYAVLEGDEFLKDAGVEVVQLNV